MYPNPNIAEELNFLVPRVQDAADRLNYISQSVRNSKYTERAIFHRLEEISDDLNFIGRYLRNLSANEHGRYKYNPVKRSRIPAVGDIPRRMEVVGRNYYY
jgi:hypothetical protein